MDQQQIVDFIKGHGPQAIQYVLMGLGALVTLGVTYVGLTPSKDDDNWLAALQEKPLVGPLFKLILAFSPVIKKEDGKPGLSNQSPEEKK